MDHKSSIPVSATEVDIDKSFGRIIQALTDDNPFLYFLNQTMMSYAQDAFGNTAVMPQYFFSEKDTAVFNQKIQNAANQIIYDQKLTKDTDLDKVRKVHDYMCRNISYDYDGSDAKDLVRLISAHNIMGVFAYRKAQCEGIAKAAKVLLNAVDVPCILATGQAKSSAGAMDAHCWNIVNIEGDPYQLDITFDIGMGTPDAMAYDYYNITDAQIRRDHVFSTGLPRCTKKEAGYFEQAGLAFSTKRQLKSYIAAQIKNGNRMLYFKLAGKLKARDIAEEMTEYTMQTASDGGRRPVRSRRTVNEAANTCRITIQ